ncbi:MAG: ClpXP protease specificity-enhancing factor [Comamonadaceae bacterium]
MIDAPDTTSTRPYLIRALYEWCTDNGLTPYVAVSVNEHVQVPREYVKDGEIVLNISFDATTSLKLGNDFIEFKARFAGTAREIMVPVSQVIAIYARENGQGMAFPLASPQLAQLSETSATSLVSVPANVSEVATDQKTFSLTRVDTEVRTEDPADEPDPPRPSATGSRPALKRVK